jgi:hypothetical protein
MYECDGGWEKRVQMELRRTAGDAGPPPQLAERGGEGVEGDTGRGESKRRGQPRGAGNDAPSGPLEFIHDGEGAVIGRVLQALIRKRGHRGAVGPQVHAVHDAGEHQRPAVVLAVGRGQSFRCGGTCRRPPEGDKQGQRANNSATNKWVSSVPRRHVDDPSQAAL